MVDKALSGDGSREEAADEEEEMGRETGRVGHRALVEERRAFAVGTMGVRG